MKLMFIGADHEVTGRCPHLEAAGLPSCLFDRGGGQGGPRPLPLFRGRRT